MGAVHTGRSSTITIDFIILDKPRTIFGTALHHIAIFLKHHIPFRWDFPTNMSTLLCHKRCIFIQNLSSEYSIDQERCATSFTALSLNSIQASITLCIAIWWSSDARVILSGNLGWNESSCTQIRFVFPFGPAGTLWLYRWNFWNYYSLLSISPTVVVRSYFQPSCGICEQKWLASFEVTTSSGNRVLRE